MASRLSSLRLQLAQDDPASAVQRLFENILQDVTRATNDPVQVTSVVREYNFNKDALLDAIFNRVRQESGPPATFTNPLSKSSERET